ncbi:NADase-type glycan-binding domain-containing protein [Maridesulfovibrio sp. FT414]|uniref:NADase-type glycan-binding domain-containing protein n=1 Tax=Maridesulfovibrio sp. FT414 TaxID=2979469 RepID=UPI003D804BF6
MIRKYLFICALILFLPCFASAGTYHVRVSSFFPQNNESVFNGNILSDGNYTTGWIAKGEDNGIGEWLHFFFPAQVVIDSVSIRNGIGTGEDFSKVNRVKEMILSYSGGQRQGFVLQDTGKIQQPEVKGYPTTSMGILIKSVYPEGGTGNAGISEVVIDYHRATSEELAAYSGAVAEHAAAGQAAVNGTAPVEKKKVIPTHEMGREEYRKAVLEELRFFFDRFYRNFVTMNQEYPRMFTEDNFLRESAMFESFRAMLDNRGVLQKYNEAQVSTPGLHFSIRTLTRDEVELWVKGDYTVIYDHRVNKVPENALYHLKREFGDWKVKNKLEY